MRRVLALLLFVSCSGVVRAQSTNASLSGRVTDPTGGVIKGAQVAAINAGTNFRYEATTNGAGQYYLTNLPPGSYQVEIEKTAFKKLIKPDVVLHVQDALTLDFAIELGPVSETITVQAGAPLLQSSATVSTVIKEQQIDNMPLNGRNVMNLAALTPGVIPQGATSGNPLGNQAAIGNYTNPAGWGNYQIGGAITGGNTEYLDGGPLNLPIANWMGLVPSQDSIREFRVETNNISPEYGRYYGGVMNFTTRSGTNQLHGTAYEYVRNTVLDANNYFNNLNKITRPPLQQNQYGVALGGPLKKDKAFFFGSWEGYRNRSGLPYETIVPTAAETTGNFTADAPIYYAGTTAQVSCNGVRNKVCPDATALYMASGYKYWAAPNIPNAPEGAINFATNASSGASSNQVTLRTDYSMSSRQQVFARYSLWKTNTLGTNYYHNDVPQPEVLTTSQQAVLGDTITINSTTLANIRASYLRFLFTSQPPSIGHVNLSDFGPAYGALQNQVTYDVLPVPYLPGYGNPFPILIINVIQYYNFDTYNMSGDVTKLVGRNAVRFGGAVRRVETYLSGNTGLGPTGLFVFVPGVPTTNQFANFMLGADLPIASTVTTASNTASINFNQGYYVYDTFHANARLTLNGGLRWEIPGTLSEKHNLNTLFLPNLASPLGTILNPASGNSQTLRGNLALVSSPSYPSRDDDIQHYHLIAPNLGFALRALRNTVVRGGYGMSFVSLDSQVPSPTWSPITALTTPALGPLSNPFPQINGVLPQPVGRDSNFSATLQGLAVTARVPGSKYPYVQQWNLNIQHQLTSDSVFQIGYQGSKGTHMELGTANINQLPDGVATQAAAQYQALVSSGISSTQADAQTFVNQQVSNPLAGRLAAGSAYNGATIAQGQMLRPYPQFGNVTNLATNVGTSTYHSLQATFEKRFGSSGTLFAAYTWAKLMGTVDTATGFLEGNTQGLVQDWNNLRGERSLESFDVPHRLVLNYSLLLPVGRGQRWWRDVGDGLDRIVSGWRLSGITSFQSGYPLALSAQTNDLANSFGAGTIRPDRIPGCQAKRSGSAVSRLGEWFNTACFVQPATPFSFGNESRVDSELRGHGINNWDLSIAKDTRINERVEARFEAEFLNAFNRVQFGPPGLQAGTPLFDVVTSTLNNPREIQLALRFNF